MSDRNPSPAGGPLVEGPRDPEHDATASYALEPEYAESLTKRLLATTGQTVEVRSPLNGAPLAHIPQSSANDVAQAFARARKAQQAWSRVSLDDRAAIMLRLHDLILDRQDEIIDLMRDMNQELLNNPFDAELQSITGPFGTLLRAIVTDIDEHGLKRHRFHRERRRRDPPSSFVQTKCRVSILARESLRGR
jgi:hypothetical protein